MDRWQQVSRLYHDALARAEGDRAAFLRQACGDDETLRREVESLLSQERRAGGFLDAPAVEIAAKMMSEEQRSNMPGVGGRESGVDLVGRQIAGYQILSRLGAGGMGEVYRARDLKLGRDVAIKVLPALFAADPERLRRFEREARLLAALNHPHIATIHGLEGRHLSQRVLGCRPSNRPRAPANQSGSKVHHRRLRRNSRRPGNRRRPHPR